MLSFLFFLLLFAAYLYLSFFNSDNTMLCIAADRCYNTSVANFVAVAFVLGVGISLIAGSFGSMQRAIANWRSRRQERRQGEIRELLEKARLYDMRGEQDKATDYVNRVIRTSPDMEEAYLLLADMYMGRREFEKARDILGAAEKSIGKKEGILLKRVKASRALKDTEKMERDLKAILETNESNLKAMGTLRDLYISREDWSGALDIEKKVRKLVKTEDENMRVIGLQYEKAKELFERRDERLYEQVQKELKEIISENKRFIPAYVLSAEVYKSTGKLNDAGRVYGRGFSKTGHVVFLSKMEELYLSKQEPAVILKIYRRLLEVAPKNQFLIFLYARLCLKLEMIDEAIDLLNTLLAEEKEFRGLHRAMAEAYIHRGEYAEAAREISKAFPMSDVYIPFYCEKCHAVKDEWSDFCESCYSWNTVNIRQEGLFRKEAEELQLLYEQDWGLA
jgi:lipopolysaccharide biosynthesis regulator YciM